MTYDRFRYLRRYTPMASPRFPEEARDGDTLHYDVAIAGGGLVGSSAALALARRGLRVGLFERRYCGAQASGVNYGGVRVEDNRSNRCRSPCVRGASGTACRI